MNMNMNTIGWYVSSILVIYIVFLHIKKTNSCSEITVNKLFQDSMYIAYQLELKKEKPLIIGFFNDGNIGFLFHFADGIQQKLDFHDNGFLAVRTLVDSFGRIQMGRYYFFESNGNLSHRYNYFDNKKVGVANSFHANSPYLREYMEYDSSGNLRYRKTIDEDGNIVKVEGD